MSWDNDLVQALDGENGQFIVGSVTARGQVSFSEFPRIHLLFSEAKGEADRLASQPYNLDKKFIVCRVSYVVQCTPVVPRYDYQRSNKI